MSWRLRIIGCLTPTFILAFIPSLLPIHNYFVSCTAQAQTSLSRKIEADNLIKQGIQQFQRSQYQNAIQSWQKALAVYQQLKDRNGEANSLMNMGNAYLYLGKYPKAIELFQESLALFRQTGDFKGEAASLNNLGLVYRDIGQYPKAIELFQESLALFRQIGDRNGEADSLNNIGGTYDYLGQHLKAINFYQQSLIIKRNIGDHNGEASSLNNLGNAYLNLGQYSKAIELFQESLTLFRQIGNRHGAASSLNGLGMAYLYLGQYPKAIEFFQQSLAIRHQIGDYKGEANSLMTLGSAYYSLGEYPKAIEFFQNSLNIYRDIGDRQNEANSLMNLGVAYSNLGQYMKVIDFYRQSLGIFHQLGDYQGETRSLNNLGVTHLFLGQYPKAIDFYKRSLSISRQLGDREGEARSLNNLGLVYFSLGQYLKAIDFYQQSLFIFGKIGARNGEAGSLNNLGEAYLNLKQYLKAIEFLQQSLAIQRDIGDRQGEATALMSLGNVYNSMGQYLKAVDLFRQSLAIFHQIGHRQGEANSLNNLGLAYNSLGQYPKAIELFQQSLTVKRDIGDREGEGRTLVGIGNVLEKQQQPELAIVFYKQSVNVRESIRQDIGTLPREQQVSYTKNIVANTYRDLASLLLQKDRVMEALQVLDLLKVQELQDYLRNIQGNERTVKGIELFPQERQILQEYTAIQAPAIRLSTELADLRKLQTPTPTQQQRVQEIEKIQVQTSQQMSEFLKSSDVEALVKQLQQTAAQKNLSLPAFQDLQIRLQRLGKRIALLYPLVLDDRLELVLLPPGKPPIHRSVAVKRTELEKMIEAFRQDLQNPNSEVKKSSQKLYDWIIKPIETDLQQADVQTIIYAPDAQMRYIPLAALYDGKKWLTERYQINYLTALALTKLEPESTAPPNVIAGAFTQGYYSLQVAGETLNFQGLPFARIEIERLGKEIPNTTQLFDKSFSRDAVLSQIQNYKIIHMATHAVFVKGVPENSFILMGDGKQINLREIEEWKLPDVTLVVLSACQTALGGDMGNGLEILGFGYQLQRTGVRASIASLWEVSDGGTQILMDAFYARLKSGNITKAEAMRQAQIVLITSQKQSSEAQRRSSLIFIREQGRQDASISRNLNHPYYWASFILIGNGL